MPGALGRAGPSGCHGDLHGRRHGAANDLTGWLAHKPDDDQLVAAWHDYYGQGCAQSCWNTTIASVAAQVPVLITEFGYESHHTSWFGDVMDWADQHGLGYLPWAWWILDDSDPPTDYVLVKAGYAPKAPEGTAYHDHLARLLHPDRALATAKPTISGTAAVGSRLTAHPGTWTSGTGFSYQWLRDGTPIGGATSSDYLVRSADARSRLSVSVTGTKDGYAAATRTSSAVAVVLSTIPKPAPPPRNPGSMPGRVPPRIP